MQSHAIDPTKIMKDANNLGTLATLCESCYKENNIKNLTSTEEDTSMVPPNLNLGTKTEQIFRGIGKIALDDKAEMFDEEGIPIDAEVTIIIKINKNSNSTVTLKKILLENLEDLQVGLKQKDD